jgi:hypothetical protein
MVTVTRLSGLINLFLKKQENRWDHSSGFLISMFPPLHWHRLGDFYIQITKTIPSTFVAGICFKLPGHLWRDQDPGFSFKV